MWSALPASLQLSAGPTAAPARLGVVRIAALTYRNGGVACARPADLLLLSHPKAVSVEALTGI